MHWIFELQSWTSHRLVTSIAAILLREYIGYSVRLNEVLSPWRLHERLQKGGLNVTEPGTDTAETW